MKSTISMLYLLLVLLSLQLLSCSDEQVATDYTDDSAYPPPAITLTSQSVLETAEFRMNEVIEGSLVSENGLRDLYITLLKNGDNGYEEISRNFRVYHNFEGYPVNQDFSLEINIADKETTAIGVIATDIYTKVAIEPIVIPVI